MTEYKTDVGREISEFLANKLSPVKVISELLRKPDANLRSNLIYTCAENLDSSVEHIMQYAKEKDQIIAEMRDLISEFSAVLKDERIEELHEDLITRNINIENIVSQQQATDKSNRDIKIDIQK